VLPFQSGMKSTFVPVIKDDSKPSSYGKEVTCPEEEP
jgi:hypothetical protein